MSLQPTNKDVQRIAKRLASSWANGCIEVSEDGLRIPAWMFYVSEAQKIWDDHCAASNLKQER